MASKKPKPKVVPVVAVLNMKGGVGKNTISAHVMRVLSQKLDKRVTLIDFDPQFNLTQTIVPQKFYERLKQVNRTVLAIMETPPARSLFKVTQAVGPPPSLEQVSIGLRSTKGGTFRLVPGDFGLVKYSLIDDIKTLKPVKERFKRFVAAAAAESDLVCIDCNPSSSFMTMCALEVATHIIVPVRPDRFSILGLELLDQYVTKVASLPAKPKFIIVLNGIPKSHYDPTVENSLRGDPRFSSNTLATRLHLSSLLAASPTYTGFASDKPVAHRHRVSANIETLAMEIGTELGIDS